MRRLIRIAGGLTGLLVFVVVTGYYYLVHAPYPVPPPLSGSVVQDTATVGGLGRTYSVYVPALLPERPALVLVFHGSRGDGASVRAATGYGFDMLADRYGFVVAYPDGFDGHWNDCRRRGPYAANKLNIDDANFVAELVEQLRAAYGIDTTRVFAAGFSNGGHMAYRLALERPGMVRAVAAVSASLPEPEELDCRPSGRPVSVLILNGTADPINPYDGGRVTLFGFGDRGRVRSSERSARYFADLAGYSWESATVTTGGPVIRRRWSGTGGVEVLHVTVLGGGHTIPQSGYRFPRMLGSTSRALDGPAEIWAFFARRLHAR